MMWAAQPSVPDARFFPERSKKQVNKSEERTRVAPRRYEFPGELVAAYKKMK